MLLDALARRIAQVASQSNNASEASAARGQPGFDWPQLSEGMLPMDPGRNMMGQMRMPTAKHYLDLPENQINQSLLGRLMPAGYDRMTQDYTPDQLWDLQKYQQ